MSERRAASLIGLAQRAGKVASGEFAAEKAIRQGAAALVLLSGDASGNTKKKFTNLANTHKVPRKEYLDKVSLGQCIGKGERSCLVITDAGFAGTIAEREHGSYRKGRGEHWQISEFMKSQKNCRSMPRKSWHS